MIVILYVVWDINIIETAHFDNYAQQLLILIVTNLYIF